MIISLKSCIVEISSQKINVNPTENIKKSIPYCIDGYYILGNGNRLYGYWGGGKNRLYNEGWLDANAPLGSNDEWDLYVIRKNNGRNKFSRNGTLLVENDGGATFDGLFINTGGCCGGETSNAQIAEVILMNNSLSDADTVNLETYLATKWGLRSALSTSHPAYIAPPPNMEAPINGFPVNNVQVWLDASKFTQDGQQIPKWNPSKRASFNY